jgi:hypothetical protein
MYRSAVIGASMGLFVIGTFMSGAIYDNEAWVARVKEMEAKVAAAEEQSKEANVRVETKIVTQTKVIKQKQEENIKYITKEITKYDNTCVIPKEFVEVHNKAASK